MTDQIIYEVEMAQTCIGTTVRFWRGEKLYREAGVRKAVDIMNELTAYHNNTDGKAVLFAVK